MDRSNNTDFFKSVTESIPQFVWTTRPDGYHDYFNQRWLDYTGLSMTEAIGDGWFCIIHPDDYERCIERWKQSLSTARAYEIELRLRRFDGTFRWHLGRAAPVKDQTGHIVQWFGTCTDIHALKTLSLDRDQLLAAISMVSKNPLIGAIRALKQLINKEVGDLNEQQVHLLHRVMASNKAITVLLRNLIDLFCYEQDLSSFHLEKIDLNTVLHSAVMKTTNSAGAREILINESLPAEATLIMGDKISLARLLQNLIENAIKFSPHGGRINLSIETFDQFALVEISDNGPGIPFSEIPLLFHPFSQEGSGRTYEQGSGLGLYLCKQIATLHNGQIWCTSGPEGVTTFSLRLPVKPPPATHLSFDINRLQNFPEGN